MEEKMNRKRYKHRKVEFFFQRYGIAIIVVCLVVALGIALGFYFVSKKNREASFETEPSKVENVNGTVADSSEQGEESQTTTDKTSENSESVLAEANTLAAMYDYDSAISLLQQQENYASNNEYQEAVSQFEASKGELVQWKDNTKITHVFFHTLIVDAKKAFSSNKSAQYNEVMTTVDEFNKMMQSMYDKGYVLVSLKDIAKMEIQADGTEKMTMQPIMLPEGKIPFVLSVDDVSYYEYMDGHGFASRLVIGEDGKVTNEMDMEDGTVQTGSFDVVPILEDFIEEHPDFSYKGAKGILALTGYNGVFGYRTSDFWYNDNCDYYINNEHNNKEKQEYTTPNLNIEEDKVKAKQVADALREQGWELASHSWGHRDLGQISYEEFQWDTDMWEREVRPILGDVDIIIFPKGADIGSWKPYEETNERYQYLKSKGFDYFCNVDSSQYWVQIGDGFFRQGRRNLDGTRLWEAINGGTDRLSDLFNAKEVIDPLRPNPLESQ